MPQKKKPKRPRIYTEVVVVRCSPEQRSAWEQLADADQRTLGEWLRLAVESFVREQAAEQGS